MMNKLYTITISFTGWQIAFFALLAIVIIAVVCHAVFGGSYEESEAARHERENPDYFL